MLEQLETVHEGFDDANCYGRRDNHYDHVKDLLGTMLLAQDMARHLGIHGTIFQGWSLRSVAVDRSLSLPNCSLSSPLSYVPLPTFPKLNLSLPLLLSLLSLFPCPFPWVCVAPAHGSLE